MECFQVVYRVTEASVPRLLALCYSEEEAKLVKAAIDRAKIYDARDVHAESLGRFQITRQ